MTEKTERVSVPRAVDEKMHIAAVKVLLRAHGIDGLPQRMLDAMIAAAPLFDLVAARAQEDEQGNANTISRGEWIAAAKRVFLVAGYAESDAKEAARIHCDEQDWLNGEIDDPYEIALESVEECRAIFKNEHSDHQEAALAGMPGRAPDMHRSTTSHIVTVGDTSTPQGRLATLITQALGEDHPAMTDLAALVMTTSASESAANKKSNHLAEQGEASSPAIYVASRASMPERPAMWRELRDAHGWRIVSTWIDESDEGATASFSDLWCRIEREIASCDVLMLYAQADDFPLKGALVEVGMALSAGKPVIVVAPGVSIQGRTKKPFGSWIKHPRVTVVDSIDAAQLLAQTARDAVDESSRLIIEARLTRDDLSAQLCAATDELVCLRTKLAALCAAEPVAIMLEYEGGEKELRFTNNGWPAKAVPLIVRPEVKFAEDLAAGQTVRRSASSERYGATGDARRSTT